MQKAVTKFKIAVEMESLNPHNGIVNSEEMLIQSCELWGEPCLSLLGFLPLKSVPGGSGQVSVIEIAQQLTVCVIQNPSEMQMMRAVLARSYYMPG